MYVLCISAFAESGERVEHPLIFNSFLPVMTFANADGAMAFL